MSYSRRARRAEARGKTAKAATGHKRASNIRYLNEDSQVSELWQQLRNWERQRETYN